jgi:phosphoribosylglycinamide formyltransferase-1
MKNIVIFASGSGSNAENIVNYFKNHSAVRVVALVCNRKEAFVFERMQRLDIPSYYFTRNEFEDGTVLKLLEHVNARMIVLAGFLKLIPESLIKAFAGPIINIHPALLPMFGGKGMYGNKVHEAVVSAGEKKSGITIHFVNDKYDEGKIIAQYETEITATDTAETVAAKVHDLEMKWFPVVIEKVIKDF